MTDPNQIRDNVRQAIESARADVAAIVNAQRGRTPTDDERIAAAVQTIREVLPRLTDDERLNVVYDLMDGYCQHCGGKYTPCYCTRDD